MADESLTPEIRSALHEFQRYLSDELAPLMVSDSVEKVIALPAPVLAGQIQAWIGGQFRGAGAEIPISDYLFHALKKIHLLAELQLIPEKKVSRCLEDLRGPIVEICPPEDRQFFEANLALIGKSMSDSDVDFLYRQPGSETKLATKKTDEGRRGDAEQRLNLMLERLTRVPPSQTIVSRAPLRNRIVSEAVSTAASTAKSLEQLDENLDQIRGAGIDVDPGQLFRHLGNSLPDWAVPIREAITDPNEGFPSSEGQPLEAMKRLLTLPDNPQEKARRFRQFIDAAVEQFNQGSLGRAVTMLGLAEGLIESGGLGEEEVERMRRTAQDQLDPGRLRGSAETPESHYLLRKLLNFFPGFRAAGILESLKQEDRRDRRRLLLALIEVFGDEARQAALQIFMASGGERLATSDPYFARNLLYVLNRIPATAESSDQEVQLADNLSSSRYPPFLTKEAIATLGQTRHPRATDILIRRLHEYEAFLAGGGKTSHPSSEIRQIIDRAVAALTKLGSTEALSAVIDHGLSRNENYGDPLRRLSPLGTRDLSDKPEIVQRLIAAVRARLPKKLLGIVMQRQPGEDVDKLLDALAGTDTPEVLELLETIRQKYPDRDFAQKAQAMLESVGLKGTSSAGAVPKLTGDLDLFGLPNLVQNLGSNEVSGVLAIMDREGKRIGAVSFDDGRISRCHTGDLRGKEAFFQLFESAGPGTFSFTERTDTGKEEADGPPMEVTPLILEGLRRFDELRSAKAIVPPEVVLAPTDVKPVSDPREGDPKVIREVWLRASSGEPPEKWEGQIPVDSYRIWRLLAHWVQSGALVLKED